MICKHQQPAFAQELSSEQRKASQQQIFNLNEAFERLSRDLGDLLRAPLDGIKAEAADDDVYVWDLRFTFPATCQLGQVRCCRNLHEDTAVTGIKAEAADDNVYVWDLRFTCPATCQLGQVRCCVNQLRLMRNIFEIYWKSKGGAASALSCGPVPLRSRRTEAGEPAKHHQPLLNTLKAELCLQDLAKLREPCVRLQLHFWRGLRPFLAGSCSSHSKP